MVYSLCCNTYTSRGVLWSLRGKLIQDQTSLPSHSIWSEYAGNGLAACLHIYIFILFIIGYNGVNIFRHIGFHTNINNMKQCFILVPLIACCSGIMCHWGSAAILISHVCNLPWSRRAFCFWAGFFPKLLCAQGRCDAAVVFSLVLQPFLDFVTSKGCRWILQRFSLSQRNTMIY